MDVLSSYRAFHEVGIGRAVVTVNRFYHQSADTRGASGFGCAHVRVLFRDDLVTSLGMSEKGDEISLRAARYEDRTLFPKLFR